MRGEGAIVFLTAFIIMLLVTLNVPTIPPGRSIYGLLEVPEIDYPVHGIPATRLAIAVFNGVFYGIIAWLLFTFGKKFIKPV